MNLAGTQRKNFRIWKMWKLCDQLPLGVLSPIEQTLTTKKQTLNEFPLDTRPSSLVVMNETHGDLTISFYRIPFIAIQNVLGHLF